MSKEDPNRNFMNSFVIYCKICIRVYRVQVGDPRQLVGKRISKKSLSSNSLNKGIVLRILNMEGINTLYQVEWEDGGQENLRVIKEYLQDQVWLDEELRSMTMTLSTEGENEQTQQQVTSNF